MTLQRTGGLGRGLQALLGSHSEPARPPGSPTVLRLVQLVPGVYQPRTRMNERALQELAESIKVQGIMQPILVRQLNATSASTRNATYEIIAGERRFRAAKLAGLDSVPVLVRDVPNEAAAAMSLIENIQREDLNPLEEAQGLQRLVAEFGLTHETAARAVGRSRSAASNLLRLLNLAGPVQDMLMAGDIDMGHARCLLPLNGESQITVASQIVARKLSVRQAEALVKKVAGGASAARPVRDMNDASDAGKPGDLTHLQGELAELLVASVEIRSAKQVKPGRAADGAGEIAIRFDSLDALYGLRDRLRRLATAIR